jgi:recombination protein RecT
MAQDRAIALKKNMENLKGMLQKALPRLQEVAASSIDPKRMIRLVAAAASRNPKLLECTPISVVSSLMTSAQLGLEPVGPLGQAYLVPYWNGQARVNEAQLQIGYRGLIELARRSGAISSLEAHVVYERDAFELVYGLASDIVHKPYLDGDPGQLRAVYAVARFKDGSVQFEVMTRAQVETIKARSQGGKNDKSPWATDYDEMARKTVVKRLCKYLPLSVEMADAIQIDNAAEEGQIPDNFLEAEISEVDETPPNDASFLNEPEVSKERGGKEEQEQVPDFNLLPEAERESGEEG